MLPILWACAALAHADRLIYIPTARKIPFRTIRYELRAEPRVEGEMEHYLGVGLTTSFELEVRSQNLQLPRPETTFDLTYNYLSPLTNLAPGFSCGVQDVMNRTSEGTRPFIAVTFRQGFYAIGGEYPADLTLGITMAMKRIYPIVGASIPFSEGTRLMVEHDGFRVSLGLELRPAPPLAFRFILREKSWLFGFVMQHRF